MATTPPLIYTVTNSGSGAYVINSNNNPTLTLIRGETYTFNVNAPGHPFWINSVSGTGTGNAYSSGVTNNGTDNGAVVFTVPLAAPNTLYYNCQLHIAMAGQFNISNNPTTTTTTTAAPTSTTTTTAAPGTTTTTTAAPTSTTTTTAAPTSTTTTAAPIVTPAPLPPTTRPPPKVFTITNTGTGSLIITSIIFNDPPLIQHTANLLNLGGGGAVLGNAVLNFPLSPGSFQTFTVDYSSTIATPGTYRGSILVGDSTGKTQTVATTIVVRYS